MKDPMLDMIKIVGEIGFDKALHLLVTIAELKSQEGQDGSDDEMFWDSVARVLGKLVSDEFPNMEEE